MFQSTIRDRGKKKWTALMLTEHVELLRQFAAEQEKIPKPELDSFDLDLLEEEISLGFRSKAEVTVKTWNNGVIEEKRGIITEINIYDRSIIVEEPLNFHRIKIDSIVSVQSLT